MARRILTPEPAGLFCPDRRGFLIGATSLTAALMAPRVASAAGARDPRLVVVILRGALDGLSAVPPVGDRDYEALRPDIALKSAGENAALKLDDTFALNAKLSRLHAMVKRGEAMVVQAVATGYRDRSHFDGQDALENGTSAGKGVDTGWLNRAVAALPSAARAAPVKSLGIGASVPLILRGPSPTMSWAPPQLDTAKADTVERLAALYAAIDPELARTLESGIEIDRMAAGGAGAARAPGLTRLQSNFLQLAEGAARLMSGRNGPRIAALSYDGWDTHAKEGAAKGRLAQLLGGLDLALEALRTGLGENWKDTAVVVVTEFGRTARENGADGTDHGNGTAAFLLGGAVKGGRVMADWPGLKERDLLDGRDLMPTTDLRSILKGVLGDHLGLTAAALNEKVFPGSEKVLPTKGLIV